MSIVSGGDGVDSEKSRSSLALAEAAAGLTGAGHQAGNGGFDDGDLELAPTHWLRRQSCVEAFRDVRCRLTLDENRAIPDRRCGAKVDSSVVRRPLLKPVEVLTKSLPAFAKADSGYLHGVVERQFQ